MGKILLLSNGLYDSDTGFSQQPLFTDLAVALGRQARFSGHTNHWWSVLHHVYAGYYVLRCGGIRLHSPTMTNWLMHDTHEALTSDIPTPFKNEGIRALESKIDEQLWSLFSIPKVGAGAARLKELDRSLCRAEAFALRPPLSTEAFVDVFGAEADRDTVRVVQAVHSMFSTAASSADGWGSYLVRWWVGRMRGALKLAGGWGDNDDEDLYLVEKMMNKNSIIYGELYDDDTDE